jgi:hypothetical protein
MQGQTPSKLERLRRVDWLAIAAVVSALAALIGAIRG